MQLATQEYVEAFPVVDLSEHPENPRRGNDIAVHESVEASGFYGAVIVQKSSGHVLAGNTRLRVARDESAETIPALVLDVDDATARRILLADNRVSDLAEYDNRQLLALLDELSVESADELYGTGYDETAMELLRAAVELDLPDPPLPPEGGFPGVDPDDLSIEHRCPSCGYEWSGLPAP